MILYNNQKSPIDAEMFPLIVQQYQHDSSFFIEISIDGADAWPASAESLENYLRSHNGEAFFAEETRVATSDAENFVSTLA